MAAPTELNSSGLPPGSVEFFGVDEVAEVNSSGPPPGSEDFFDGDELAAMYGRSPASPSQTIAACFMVRVVSCVSATVETPGRPARSTCKYPACYRPRCIKDTASGEEHHYCGLTHAREHRHSLGLAPPHLPLCKLFGCLSPVCEEGTRVHDFCCMSHALEAIDAGEHPPSRPAGLQDPAPKEKQCALPGCERHRNHSLEVDYEYCSKDHALAAQMELCSIAKVKQRRRDEL